MIFQEPPLVAPGASAKSGAGADGAPPNWRGLATLGVLILGFGILLFARCMDGGLNHDEHQFLAPAALLAREGLLPYRDFPLFHLPNVIFVYATLERISSHLIFSAKAFSILCSVTAAALIAFVAYRAAALRGPIVGVVAAGLILTLLFFDPLFRTAVGKTWNHDFPTLCILLALVCTIANARGCSTVLALLAGIAAGLALGARLTFAPAVVPLCAACLCFESPWNARWRLLLAFGGGFLVSLLPIFWLCWTAPDAFLFDNFQFPRLRLLDPTDSRAHKTAVWWRKVRFFAKEVVLPGWPIFAAYLLIGLPPALR